jgi:hypothetical protein
VTQTVANLITLLDQAQREAAHLNLSLQHAHTRTLHTSHVIRSENRLRRLLRAITSTEGLVKTGHAVEAYRHLSAVLGS